MIRRLFFSAIIAMFLVSCSRPSVEDQICDTLNKLYTAIGNGDMRTAEQYMVISERKRQLYDACAEGIGQQYVKAGGVKEISVRDIVYDLEKPREARVKFKLRLGNGKIETFEETMVLDGKQWKRLE